MGSYFPKGRVSRDSQFASELPPGILRNSPLFTSTCRGSFFFLNAWTNSWMDPIDARLQYKNTTGKQQKRLVTFRPSTDAEIISKDVHLCPTWEGTGRQQRREVQSGERTLRPALTYNFVGAGRHGCHAVRGPWGQDVRAAPGS